MSSERRQRNVFTTAVGSRSSSPMMANAVALYSLPLTPSKTSSLDPSISQRLIVLFPELIQYSCSFSKSIDSPGKNIHTCFLKVTECHSVQNTLPLSDGHLYSCIICAFIQ